MDHGLSLHCLPVAVVQPWTVGYSNQGFWFWNRFLVPVQDTGVCFYGRFHFTDVLISLIVCFKILILKIRYESEEIIVVEQKY